MAISTGQCVSFRKEVMQGVHNLDSATVKMALYTSSATLNSDTTQYRSSNEISGTGYSSGGKVIDNMAVSSVGSSGIADGDDIQWTSSTFTAAGCLVYNDSATDKPAIATFSFGGNRTVSSGTFTVQLPEANEGSAFIEIGN